MIHICIILKVFPSVKSVFSGKHSYFTCIRFYPSRCNDFKTSYDDFSTSSSKTGNRYTKDTMVKRNLSENRKFSKNREKSDFFDSVTSVSISLMILRGLGGSYSFLGHFWVKKGYFRLKIVIFDQK